MIKRELFLAFLNLLLTSVMFSEWVPKQRSTLFGENLASTENQGSFAVGGAETVREREREAER
jgi:hypothetical protein